MGQQAFRKYLPPPKSGTLLDGQYDVPDEHKIEDIQKKWR
jgi:hypothetical protein